MWEVEQDWMPGIRSLCDAAEQQGKGIFRLRSIDELDGFTHTLDA
jgi:hypothetical protein